MDRFSREARVDADRSLIFKMKGIYSKELKNMFEALAKFASNSMDFHLLVNKKELCFISTAKGSITSNILKINDKYFSEKFEFNEKFSNTETGFAMKVDFKAFDQTFKLWDHDQSIQISYHEEDESILISQENEDESLQITKNIHLNRLLDDNYEMEVISSDFIKDSNFLVDITFGNAFVFKTPVEKVFHALKLDCLVFNFDFTQNPKVLFVENEDPDEIVKVIINKFMVKRGESKLLKFKYLTKLLYPALSFFTKDSEINLKIDMNGTLFLVTRVNDTTSETVIPSLVDHN